MLSFDPISNSKIEETMHQLKMISQLSTPQYATSLKLRMTAFSMHKDEDASGGKVGYLAEYASTKKFLILPRRNNPKNNIRKI